MKSQEAHTEEALRESAQKHKLLKMLPNYIHNRTHINSLVDTKTTRQYLVSYIVHIV